MQLLIRRRIKTNIPKNRFKKVVSVSPGVRGLTIVYLLKKLENLIKNVIRK